MKSGFVALIGRPNAGKSTLLNALIDKKLAITSPKAQTTRNSILGIYNQEDLQLIFIDTPGIHEAKTYLGSYMNKEAYSQANGADVIYYLVDATVGINREDEAVLEKLFSYEVPIFCIFNKIDEVKSDRLIKRCTYAANNFNFAEIIPLSALKRDNLVELLKTTVTYLHDGILYYPKEVEDVQSIEFKISEIIREKIIMNLSDEIPHLSAVQIDEYKEGNSKVKIGATVIVNKESHKAIIIGKQGAMLKRINSGASLELSKLLNKRIYLSLYIRVEEDWLNKQKRLFDLGYFNE